MELKNFICDALKKDTTTEISINLTTIPNKSIGSVVPLQKPEKWKEEVASVARQQLETVEDYKSSKSTEQPEGSILTNAKTTPEVQTPNSFVQQQMDLSFEMKAATSRLNTENNYLAAVEKNQENTLKHQDNLQVQNIQSYLYSRQPIPITENIGVKSEFPLDVLPPEWMALLSSFSDYLNVPLIALVSSLLASICIATRGQYKIEVEKDRYTEAFTFYFIVVMLSGAKKSAIVQLFKSVFDKRLIELQAEHDAKVLDPKMTKELYEKSRKKLIGELCAEVPPDEISEINRQFKKIKRILVPLEEKMENSSARPNFFNDSCTMKKLGENMAQQNEFIAIFDAEPDIWKHRVRANDNVILLKGYTMEYFGSETATNGSVIMQSPCLTICSYVQPGVAFKLYSKEDLKDDGLLPRILPVFCLSKQGIQNMIAQEIDPELMAMYEAKITSILEY